jgi:dCMP deaminase
MIDVNKPIEKVGGWDEYFYGICRAVAANSKCFSRQIGAILVRDKSVFSTGYNGPPKGVPPCDQRWYNDSLLLKRYWDGLPDPELVKKADPNGAHFRAQIKEQCPRRVLGLKSGEGIDLCPAGHGEENAILNAAKMGIETKGATMYMTCGVPCAKCLVKIINACVEELVVTSFTIYDESTQYLLDTSGIKVRLFDFL